MTPERAHACLVACIDKFDFTIRTGRDFIEIEINQMSVIGRTVRVVARTAGDVSAADMLVMFIKTRIIQNVVTAMAFVA